MNACPRSFWSQSHLFRAHLGPNVRLVAGRAATMTQAGVLDDYGRDEVSIDRLLLLLSSLSGQNKRDCIAAAIKAVVAQQEVGSWQSWPSEWCLACTGVRRGTAAAELD